MAYAAVRVRQANRTKKRRRARQEDVLKSFLPDALVWRNIDWPVLLWIVGMHLGCLAGPFCFSWSAVGAAIVLNYLTSSLGICLGYHRYLTHQGMALSRPVQFVLLLFACLAAQGPPLTWAATHRLHHAKSDEPGDPHSPKDGKWWSHMLWLFVRQAPGQKETLYRKYAPDLMHDPMLRFFEWSMIYWSYALAVLLYWVGGWAMVVWGLCVRMTVVYHSTWFVNSATHLWGYRNYPTRDNSRNLWWVALLANGEGWHNNHHAVPRCARHGHHWYELDPTWWSIRLLKAMGLASRVHDQVPDRAGRRLEQPADDPPTSGPVPDNGDPAPEVSTEPMWAA